jgi:hypothetical protein
MLNRYAQAKGNKSRPLPESSNISATFPTTIDHFLPLDTGRTHHQLCSGSLCATAPHAAQNGMY